MTACCWMLKIESLCFHFREVFVLWDGEFLLARTVNPMELDVITYRRYVLAAVEGWATKWKIGLSGFTKPG